MKSELYVMKIELDETKTYKYQKIMDMIVGRVKTIRIVKKLHSNKSKRHYYAYKPGLLDSIPYLKITNKVYVIKFKFPIGKELVKHIKFYKIKHDLLPIDLSNMNTGYDRALIKAILLDVPVKNLTTDKVFALSNYEESRIARGILK